VELCCNAAPLRTLNSELRVASAAPLGARSSELRL
jgi:hypothetical protein